MRGEHGVLRHHGNFLCQLLLPGGMAASRSLATSTFVRAHADLFPRQRHGQLQSQLPCGGADAIDYACFDSALPDVVAACVGCNRVARSRQNGAIGRIAFGFAIPCGALLGNRFAGRPGAAGSPQPLGRLIQLFVRGGEQSAGPICYRLQQPISSCCCSAS